MANLTFAEKDLIERVFQMQSGYVSELSNRQFQEVMKEVINDDIYRIYPNLSKAKMLRAFCADYPDEYVGKMVCIICNYMIDHNLVTVDIKSDFKRLAEWGNEKLGRRKTDKKPNIVTPKESPTITTDTFHKLEESLTELSNSDGSQQSKGYKFEKILYEMFDSFGMNAKPSYRTEYDQIDGSFQLDGNTILLEAKYRNSHPNKDDIILFQEKIKKKSPYTKGVIITLMPFAQITLDQFTDRSSRVIVMYVHELYLICNRGLNLTEVIRKKFRCLDERGVIFEDLMKL